MVTIPHSIDIDFPIIKQSQHSHSHTIDMASTGWDDQVVIGRKTTGPRVVRDQATVNAARRAGESVDAAKKTAINATHVGPDHQRIAKLDRVNEVAPPAKIKPSVAQAMKDARIALSMTQKDLAAKTNEKPTVIGDYEAARAVPSPQILAKFERVLKVKLRGKDIGAPLAPPGKKT
ncbi:hypothetical protein PCANC_00774 [Puccinia coronata f. sp. avenae]|uniref:HTH cro/C1-type domain-containing protein n=2 Tax=Puccinia coronata f. sp. avenae TaxID=200324 RepID=A0A2N5STU9_9BASI|nr:hypothetical protein PCANC_13333 [Puccinia coronata f. sp. avenae]PLW58265.1 hypothetical protein PCANC_00774 [Puccinia coronata f. sp. avenae]